MAIHTMNDLKQLQAMPLQIKILMSKTRIRAWIDEFGVDGVYISFSGGKDSTVLLDLVREDYPNVKAMFVDTGLEYPEIREFVKTFDNVDIIRPKMNFKQVIEKYGYPFIGKEVSKNVYYAKRSLERGDLGGVHLKKLLGTHTDNNGDKSKFCTEKYKFLLDSPFPISSNCCDVMKKAPAHSYEEKNLKICSVYGDVVVDYGSEDQLNGQLDFSDFGLTTDNRKLKTTGCSRTGCMFCGYGCHLEKPGEGRFERMKETHPKLYDYIMRPKEQGGLNYKEVIDWINENGNLNIRY